MMAETAGGGGRGGGNHSGIREYRKGNWTVSETMILIEAKKMDDERRLRRSIGLTSDQSEQSVVKNKPTELRWKWIEDYCWSRGCLRSQNQCNDKWDNLMRDYKKVREYERKSKLSEESSEKDHNNNPAVTEASCSAYWKMEKSERKEKNLPSNMLPQIYEALLEVVEKRVSGAQRVIGQSSGVSTYGGEDPQLLMPPSSVQYHHHRGVSAPMVLPLPLPPPPLTQSQSLPLPQSHQPLPTVDSDSSEHSESPAKRRKKSATAGGGNAEAAGTSGTTTGHRHEVGTAITKSASVIAEALLACEERQDKRHRDLASLQERRLKIEESKAEISRQGFSGLVEAINKLSNSICTLASHHQSQPPPAP